MGLKLAGRAGPGPNIHGLGRAWAGPGPKFLFAGLGRAGLEKLLRAWAGPGLKKIVAGLGRTRTGPGF